MDDPTSTNTHSSDFEHEQKRLQELFKVFQSTSRAIGHIDNDIDSDEAYSPDLARLSSDPTLNALAQLGAQRTNCNRSFISLIDNQNQHIIAEASKSISLYDGNHHQPGDQLALGERPLDLFAGVCAGTMKVFTARHDRFNINTPNIVADHTRYVINDFEKEDLYKSRPYVKGFPFMRFYAEVPLKTESGYVIGSYCVVDDKPRAGLEEEGFIILKEIASTIMRHLDLVKANDDHLRAGRLLQGLNLFVQGGPSFRKSSQCGGSTTDQHTRGTLMIDEKTQGPKGRKTSISMAPNATTPGSITQQPEAVLRADEHASLSTSTLMMNKSDFKSSKAKPDSVEGGLQSFRTPLNDTEPPPDTQGITSKRESVPSQTVLIEQPVHGAADESRSSTLSGEIQENFTEAAMILREAMGLDGVVFLDANTSTFGSFNDLDRRGSMSGTVTGSRLFHGTHSAPIFEPRTPDGEISQQKALGRLSTTSLPQQPRAMCRKLGFSVQERPSSTGRTAAPALLNLPEDLHQSLLKHYSRGHIFNFDVDESFSPSRIETTRYRESGSGTTESLQSTRTGLESGQQEAALSQIFPDACSLIFVPLWNPHKVRWFAGSIGWTKDRKRVLLPEELAYFSAFGNSLMAEVSRLELLETDRAKADFISSISHEIRSPLHGILGTAELLREISPTKEQHQMIGMIENCGQILLETLNHILDYSKINGNVRSRKQRVSTATVQREAFSPGTFEAESSFDLSALIEDAVECVLAGHRFHVSSSSSSTKAVKRPAESFQSHWRKEAPLYGESVSQKAPDMILCIENKTSWCVRSEAGSWSRILMNLVGNAVKYTSAGFVEVCLRSQKAEKNTSQGDALTLVTLTVSDTGRGISKEYLQNHLYTPFAQESALSVGAGLGLSIVHQLVTDLGGTVDIQSELGVGTQVTVAIPVATARNPSLELEKRARRHENLTLCLVAFDVYPSDITIPTAILSKRSRLANVLKKSLITQAKQWFGIHVISVENVSSIKGDIIAVREDSLHLFEVDSSDGSKSLRVPDGFSLIVLCNDLPSNPRPSNDNTKRIHYLRSPFGPRSMAEALSSCIQEAEIEAEPPVTQEYVSKPAVSNNASYQIMKSNTTGDLPLLQQGTIGTPAAAFSLRSKQTDDAASDSAAVGASEPAQSSCVLLVDDNEINLKMLVTYMKKLNCAYATASNGLEALEKFRASPQKFDYVLMDVSMPVMDGFASTRAIRAFEREKGLPATPVIAITGLGSTTARDEAFTSGINVFLTKPVPMKRLKELMQGAPVEHR